MSRICNSLCNNSFANHVKLACTSDAGKQVGISSDYKKNVKEKVGNFLLWPVRNVPSAALNGTCHAFKAVKNIVTNPQCVAVAATAGTVLAGSYQLYPTQTKTVLSSFDFFKKHALEGFDAIKNQNDAIANAVRFVAFAGLTATVVGVGMRYCGRITQEQIKNAFYAKPSANTQVAQEV